MSKRAPGGSWVTVSCRISCSSNAVTRPPEANARLRGQQLPRVVLPGTDNREVAGRVSAGITAQRATRRDHRHAQSGPPSRSCSEGTSIERVRLVRFAPAGAWRCGRLDELILTVANRLKQRN